MLLWAASPEGEPDVISVPLEGSLEGRAFASGAVLRLADAYEDDDFRPEHDPTPGERTRSLLCAPMFDEDGAPVGVLEATNALDGIFSDEDQGLMGSLAVLMKIGLFQLDGGVTADPVYQVGSPIFDRIRIQTDPAYHSGKPFIIEAVDNSAENRYIQSMTLNGAPLQRHYLYHREIVDGGRLELRMGPEPVENGVFKGR